MAVGGTRGRPRRGVSEVIGIVLLFGFVVAGAATVVVVGSSAQDAVSEHSTVESASAAVGEMDARLSSLARRGDTAPVSVELTDRVDSGESVTVEAGDRLTLQFDDGGGFAGDCEATVSLDRIDYRVDDETTLRYQAGGVFRTVDGETVVETPPDVGLVEGRLSVSTFDLPAGLDHEFTAQKLPTDSHRRSSEAVAELFDRPGCLRPDGARIVVESTAADGWHRYLASEFDDRPGVTVSRPGPERVVVDVPESVLPEVADDDRNQVVAFNRSDVAGEATTTGTGVELTVDKGVSNQYDAGVRVLGGDVGFNDTTRHTKEVQQYRYEWDPSGNDPLDLVFVMDDSGSMCGGGDGKLAEAKAAVEEFTDQLESDGKDHRAALVRFSDGAATVQSSTTDLGEVADATGDLGQCDGTDIDAGLSEGLDQLHGGEDRSQAVILMTDGQSGETGYGGCSRPLGGSVDGSDTCTVAEAVGDDVGVHTVAFGGGADEDLMRDIANDTDGAYAHADEGELEETFERIVGRGEGYFRKIPDGVETYYITDYRGVLHEPVTLTQDHDGTTYGGGPPVESALTGPYDGTVAAPSVLVDGEPLTAEATRHTCDLPDPSDRETVERNYVFETNDSDPDTYPYTDAANGSFASHYNEYRCAAGATTSLGAATDVHVAVHGDPVSAVTDGDTPVAWQDRLSTVVDPHTEGGQFDLASNQVVVVYEFDDGGAHDTNGLVLLYEVGRSTDTVADTVLDLDVTVVEEVD